jgi:hypothetical protein
MDKYILAAGWRVQKQTAMETRHTYNRGSILIHVERMDCLLIYAVTYPKGKLKLNSSLTLYKIILR